MTGRTTWYPNDAAEHDRELIVELGDEFGPAGPLVMRVLKDLAAQQSLRTGGHVRTGFRILAKKCANIDRDQAREIVERAAEIGALDELVVDDDGRRFLCRVSGWEADFARGKETLKKGDQRAGGSGRVSPDEGDTSPDEGDTSPQSCPTGQDRTGENTSSLREDAHPAGAGGESTDDAPALKVVATPAAAVAPKVKHAGKVVPAERLALAEAVVADFNAQAGTGYRPLKASGQPSDNLKRVLTALADHPEITADVAQRMVAGQLAAPYWGTGRPQLGNVFGPGVVERNLEQALNPPSSGVGQHPRSTKYDHITRRSA